MKNEGEKSLSHTDPQRISNNWNEAKKKKNLGMKLRAVAKELS